MRGLDAQEEATLRNHMEPLSCDDPDYNPSPLEDPITTKLFERGLIHWISKPDCTCDRNHEITAPTATGLLLLRILDTERNLP